MGSCALRSALCALILLSCARQPPPEKLLDIGTLALTDHDGRAFTQASMHGHPSLLFFGYTHCPDACPTMMSKVSRAYRLAGADARAIPTYFVSVDPRDTPAVLKQYLAYFGAVPARGLTGTKPQIDSVVKQFGAVYQIRDTGSAAGPMVDHTVRLYLLDREGDVVKLFDPATEPKEIADALREIEN
jgi:protein SCO1/2